MQRMLQDIMAAKHFAKSYYQVTFFALLGLFDCKERCSLELEAILVSSIVVLVEKASLGLKPLKENNSIVQPYAR